MASPDKPIPGDPYLSWEQLLDEEQPGAAAEPAEAAAGLPADFALPPDLQALTRERERLEKELKQLTGAAEPDPEDERLARMFPVKVHTKESRIEERRLRQRDELLRMLEKRAMEQRRIAARVEQRREQLRAQLRQNTLEEQRLRGRWARERREALAQASRERALEAAWHARREALRQFRSERRPRDEVRDEGFPSEATPQAPTPSDLEEKQCEASLQRMRARAIEQRAFEEARERQQLVALDRATERRAGEQRETEQREAQRRAAERRTAERRDADRREVEQREAEQREADRRTAEKRAVGRREASRTRAEGWARQLHMDKAREDRVQEKRGGRRTRI